MDRDQIRDGLAELASQAKAAEQAAIQSQEAAQRAYDIARRMERGLAEPFDPPGEPEEPAYYGWMSKGLGGKELWLPGSQRATIPQRPMDVLDDAGMAPFAEMFRTEAGGVIETTVALHNGDPRGKGAITIPRLEIKTHNGRTIFDQANVVIDPGQMLVVTDYQGGTIRDFAAALAEDKPTPGEAFDKMLAEELERQLAREPDVLHYVMGWPGDPGGASQGGDGIEPYWHNWRHTPDGRALALLEVQRTAQREFRVMTDETGAFTWDPEIAYNADGDFMPDSHKLDLSGPLGKWRSHDAQHLARATRAAMWIDEITNGRHGFTRWYLEMMANFQAACALSTAADKEGVDESNWWSLHQTIRWAWEQDGPNPKCGRGMVHRSRLLFYCANNGIGGDEIQGAADLAERLWFISADRQGRSFQMEASKIPEVKAEMKKPGGGRAKGWQDADACAQSRELQLAVAMMRDSERPSLVSTADRLAQYLGPFPATQLNFTREDYFGGTNPYYELMTHGDTTAPEFGGPRTPPEERRKKLLEVAATRGVEAGGSQPLNSCRDAGIWRGER